MGSTVRNFLIGAGLCAATLLAYFPALRAEFIWNDAEYVTAPGLRSWQGLGRIWSELGATEQYYPFLHSAFWLQHRLWGDAPTGYHLFNVALHAAAACLLAGILSRLAIRGAWLAAFGFALHPVGVESVAWISEQKNTLSLVFYLLAAGAYLRFSEAWHGRLARGLESSMGVPPMVTGGTPVRLYVIATTFFVIALLSKSVTATLPAALLVVFWWQRGRLEWRRDVVPLLPWFVLGAAMGLFSAWVERKYIGADGAEFALNLSERALLAGRIAWFYVGKVLWPAELIFIYPRWTVDAGAPGQWLWSLAVLATLGGLWRLRRWNRAPLAAVLFFGGSLFPTLGFFNVYAFLYSFVADHWQYLPSIGLIVLGAAGLTSLLARTPALTRRGLPVLLVTGLGGLSFHQSRMYADMRTFYRTTLDRNPAAWMAHNNLGNLLREDGKLEEARVHFEAALRVRRNLEKVHNNLGNVLRDQRRPAEAIAHYREALAIRPDYVDALNNLGSLLRQQKQVTEALELLQRAVQLDPKLADAHNNLGVTLRDAGQVEASIAAFQQALRLDGRMAAAHLNLALSCSILGREREAMEHYQNARRLNPAIPPLPAR